MLITDIIRDRKFTGKLLALTFPITLQQLMLALVAAADALMLGKLDQDAMAAVSLATQIQFVQNMLLGAICSGVAILGAHTGAKMTGKFSVRFSVSASGNRSSFHWCFFPDVTFSRNI